MSCNIDRYKYVVDQIANGLNYVETQLTQYFGDWAFLAMLAILLPVGFLFAWSQYILMPRFVKWYYDKTIVEKAKDWYTQQGLAFLGFRHSTAIISVVVGVLFYMAIRVAFAVPDDYLGYASLSLVVLLFLIPLIGLLVGGNVPENEKDIMKYCKRFLSPTVTGLGLAIGTIFLDLLINATPIAVNAGGIK